MFEYVASGSSYFKLMYAESLEPQNLDFFSRTFGSLNNTSNHKVSLLYNAYVEKRQGEWMGEHYRSRVHSIHADSACWRAPRLSRCLGRRDPVTAASSAQDRPPAGSLWHGARRSSTMAACAGRG